MSPSAAHPKTASPLAKRVDIARRAAQRPASGHSDLATQEAVRRLAAGRGLGADASVQRVLGPQLCRLHGLIGNQAVARLVSREVQAPGDAARLISRKVAPSRDASRLIGREVAPSRDVDAGGGAGLPPNLRGGIEEISGISMADVRVHTNSPRPAALQAHAYASGGDIHLAPGQERHLPHEAWHIVQQRQGRVEPGLDGPAGLAVNDDPSLEAEADRMGAAADRMGPAADRIGAGAERMAAERMGAGAAGRGAVSADEAPPTRLEVARSTRPDVIQGKWFRMSTVLERRDEEEVAEIRGMAEAGRLPEAFLLVVRKYPELTESYRKIVDLARRSSEVGETVDNILWETFDDPLTAYTAAQVVDLLEENETIVDAADLLTEEDDREIESLIAKFDELEITTFRSDVDGGREEHAVFWGRAPSVDASDVIVASNPKPLKTVLAAAVWEGYPLSSTLVTQLGALRKAAKLALYAIGGNAKRGITGSRTQGKMNTFRVALTAIAKILGNLGGATHKATLLPATNLSGSAQTIEGTHVVARPLSINSAASGSKPRDGRLMKAIRALAGTQSKSYVQMHLLNDLVFGPGALWNLTPGPKQSNVDMELNVEDPLKRAVLGKGLVITFDARVTYANDPTTASLTNITQNPDKYRFQHIDFKAKQLEYDPVATTWKTATTQDADVLAIDGARVNWRYGSLIPLRPKPRILDPATTAQNLQDVGVQPAAAARIVAFVNANPTWRPRSAGKQQHLATAVRAWDNGSRAPNISSWKATAVLWT